MVVERRKSAKEFVSEKAYLYLVDKRGQKFLDRHGISLDNRGVPNDGYTVVRVTEEAMSKPIKPPIKSDGAVWMQRSELCGLLDEEARSRGVDIVYETSAEVSSDGKVSCCGQTYAPKFVVGADGANSRVARAVFDTDPIALDSPSAGLNFKILSVPAYSRMRVNGSLVGTNPEQAYAMRSTKGVKLRLGWLPVKRGSLWRTANVVADSRHPIFKIRDSQELKRYLDKAFPQLVLDQKDDSLLESFASAEPGIFPKPQYREQFTRDFGDDRKLFLVGDACHSFPPDLGQGVNSALEDVLCLENDRENYDRIRVPQARALAHLVRVGFPYQYSQGNRFQRSLFTAGFVARLALSKIVPFNIVAKPVALDVLAGLPYDAVWKKAQRTTLLLKALFVTALTAVLLVKAF